VSAEDWTTANQRVLAAEIARVRARVGGEHAPAIDETLAAARAALPAPAAIDVLTTTFGLTAFERDTLLLCASAELHGAITRPPAAATDPARPEAITFGLALDRLEAAHWSALTPMRPLRLLRLVEIHDERMLTTSRLNIDERVLHYLAGINYLDPRLRSLVRTVETTALLGDRQASVVDEIEAALRRRNGAAAVIQLVGDDTASQLEVARRVAERGGLKLHLLLAAEIPASVHESEALSVLWVRDSMLLGSALCVQVDDASPTVAQRFARQVGGLTFLCTQRASARDASALHFQVDRPARCEQKHLWNQALGETAARLNGSLDAVASQFRLGTDAIAHAADSIRANPASGAQLERALWIECRESVRERLSDLAQRIEPAATWRDLVLPGAQLATLRLVVAHVRQRNKVHDEWGFAAKSARGLGISVLFSGESGTGKTLAAEVLANELQLDLFRIDLASMVSKYIGETEKNLRRVFDAAEDSGAILLFDEADALFGKRSEVKDSHDRYANLEVSYLLQRMECYEGLAILTTNLKNALDAAFLRRLRFVVQFPFPDRELRERIWRSVFPHGAPLENMDFARLAQLNVAGGNIRNIAFNAAFLAAEERTPIGMAQLLQAALGEAAKRDRPYSDAETRGWI
jgi:hypothetical protein